jgi:hypothetical protein
MFETEPREGAMADDVVTLDGNAAAGTLSEVFADDVTSATIVCGHCGRRGPLAELRLYRSAGTVLRCKGCGHVNMRLLETGSTITLDMNGAAYLVIGRG